MSKEDKFDLLVKEIKPKGYGAFAKRRYANGELICIEYPFVFVLGKQPFSQQQIDEIHQSVEGLSPEKKKIYYSLSNCFSVKENIEYSEASVCENNHISNAVGIFRTNCFDMNGFGCALYASIARVNHACAPNARQHYDELTQSEHLVACKDIEINEEVTISYIDIRQSTTQRREILQKSYGFHCVCSLCSAFDKNPTLRRFLPSS